jgi:hypothetical protein
MGISCPDPTKVTDLRDSLIKSGIPADRIIIFDHNTPETEIAARARAASQPGMIVIFTNLGGRGKDWMSAYNDVLDEINKQISKNLSAQPPVTLERIVASIEANINAQIAKIQKEIKAQGGTPAESELRLSLVKYESLKAGLDLFKADASAELLRTAITPETIRALLSTESFQVRSFNLVIYEKPAGGLPDFIQALNRADRGSKGGSVWVLSCTADDIFTKTGIDPATLITAGPDGRYHANISAAELLRSIPDIRTNWDQYKQLFKSPPERWDGRATLEFVDDFATKLERAGLSMTVIVELEKAWRATDLGRIATLSEIALSYVSQQEISRTNPDPFKQATIDDQESTQKIVSELNNPVRIEYALQQMRMVIARDMFGQVHRDMSEADFVKHLQSACKTALFVDLSETESISQVGIR